MFTVEEKLAPFLKWAGGKRQICEEIKKYLPDNYGKYYEPFIGGGALLLSLQPSQAVIADLNEELINCYLVIKNQVEPLLEACQALQNRHNSQFYYWIRDLCKSHDFQDLPAVTRAARFIYLNKTCYNGLFRVNLRGEFNVPVGKFKATPQVVNRENLQNISKYLQGVEILQGDFSTTLENPEPGSLIYCDPPYYPITEKSFVGYTNGGFNPSDQIRLKQCLDSAIAKDCYVICSNSNHQFIRDLYAGYELIEVSCPRRINSSTTGRGDVTELLAIGRR